MGNGSTVRGGNKMLKKRMTGIVVSLMLMAALVPAGVFADDEALPGNNGEVCAEEIAAEGDPEQAAVAEESVFEADANRKMMSAAGVSAAAATRSLAPNGGSASGTIRSYNDVYKYAVDLPSSGRLRVRMNAGIDLNMTISCTMPDNSTDGRSYRVDRGVYEDQWDLGKGRCWIEIQSYSGEGSFSFTTSFESAGETYTGFNNSVNAVREAKAVDFNKVIRGQIAINDDTDFYKVVLNSSGRLSIGLHSDIMEGPLYIGMHYGDNEREGLWDMEYGDRTDVYDLAPGTYYFEFSQRYYTGNYSFSLSFTPSGETYTGPNNSINAIRNSAAIPLGTAVTGQLAFNDIADGFRIDITDPGDYIIDVNAVAHDEDLGIVLYDSGEDRVEDKSGNYGNSLRQGSGSYRYSLSAGTYYLFFTSGSSYGYRGPFSFSVTAASSKKEQSGVQVPATKLTKVVRAKKSLRLKWKKKNVSGYQIQCSTDPRFLRNKKTVTVNKGKTVSKTVKKLRAKTKYYVRIRSYKTINGRKRYSAWSAVKSARTK